MSCHKPGQAGDWPVRSREVWFDIVGPYQIKTRTRNQNRNKDLKKKKKEKKKEEGRTSLSFGHGFPPPYIAHLPLLLPLPPLLPITAKAHLLFPKPIRFLLLLLVRVIPNHSRSGFSFKSSEHRQLPAAMIVRTYGRRNRCVGRSPSEDDELLGQSQDSSDVFGDFPPPPHLSSQDQDSPSSTSWSLDPHLSFWADSDSRPSALLDHAPGPAPAPARPKRCSRNMPPTSTLMEAQEFGEMMEHVDEVNFAVDGLRRGLPARVRRSSLLSLLSISSTPQHRRLLRAQG